jgi:hypothetical protein
MKRCDELENKINNIIKEMDRFKKSPFAFNDIPSFLSELKNFLVNRKMAEHTYMDEIEQ